MPNGRETFKVRSGGRILKVIHHERVQVRLTWFTRLIIPKRYKKGPSKGQRIPTKAEFTVAGISGMKWSNGWWLWPGKLTIDAPPNNDPWTASGRTRPHRFLCAYRSANEARLIQIAWVIQLAYAQANNGLLLTRLPPAKPIPPPWWQRLFSRATRATRPA